MLNLTGHTAAIRSVCYSADGRLASGGDDGTVRLWEPSTGKPVATKKAGGGVEALSFEPDGKGLVVGLAAGGLVLRRGARWAMYTKAGGAHREGGVRALAHAPDGRLLSCGWNGQLLLWEAGTLAKPVELQKFTKPLTALAVSPDSMAVATAVSGGSVSLFDLTTNKLLASFGTHSPPPLLALRAGGVQRKQPGGVVVVDLP